MRDQRESCFYNVTMSSFRVAIMFKSVWMSNEMKYSIGSNKIGQSDKFSTIICIKCVNFKGEMVFNNDLKLYKNILHLRFLFKWVKPNVFGEVINKDDIVLKPSLEKTSEVHTSEKILCRDCEETSELVEKESLWLLLL